MRVWIHKETGLFWFAVSYVYVYAIWRYKPYGARWIPLNEVDRYFYDVGEL